MAGREGFRRENVNQLPEMNTHEAMLSLIILSYLPTTTWVSVHVGNAVGESGEKVARPNKVLCSLVEKKVVEQNDEGRLKRGEAARFFYIGTKRIEFDGVTIEPLAEFDLNELVPVEEEECKVLKLDELVVARVCCRLGKSRFEEIRKESAMDAMRVRMALKGLLEREVVQLDEKGYYECKYFLVKYLGGPDTNEIEPGWLVLKGQKIDLRVPAYHLVPPRRKGELVLSLMASLIAVRLWEDSDEAGRTPNYQKLAKTCGISEKGVREVTDKVIRANFLLIGKRGKLHRGEGKFVPNFSRYSVKSVCLDSGLTLEHGKICNLRSGE